MSKGPSPRWAHTHDPIALERACSISFPSRVRGDGDLGSRVGVWVLGRTGRIACPYSNVEDLSYVLDDQPCVCAGV